MLKQRAYRTLDALRIPKLLVRRGRRLIRIAYYHGFTERDRNPGILNSEGLHLHVDVFRRHLEHLREHFSVVSLGDALDAMEHGSELPDNPVVLTMDDGYRSNYELAYPLLREFSMPATIFLATDFVDRRKYLWTDRVEFAIDHAQGAALVQWAGAGGNGPVTTAVRGDLMRQTKRKLKAVDQETRGALVNELEATLETSLSTADDVPREYEPLMWREVEEMLQSGLISFGSHSSSHFILARCTEEQIVEDIQNARAVIEARIGVPCRLFCYPNGRAGDFDYRTRKAIIDAGHRCALTTLGGFNRPDGDPFEMRRVGVMNGDTDLDFVMAMCGVRTWVRRTGSTLRGLGSRARTTEDQD